MQRAFYLRIQVGSYNSHDPYLFLFPGSLVIDIMSANGCQEPPIPQRVFWALVEGATATALLVAGGKDALGALQVGSFDL